MSASQLRLLDVPAEAYVLADGLGPHCRSTDPETSQAAARTVNFNRRCQETLPFLRSLGLATAHDVSKAMLAAGYEWAEKNTVSRRLGDLEELKLARRVDQVTGHQGRPVFRYEAVS